MPIYTNKYNLPSSLIHAIDQSRADYDNGGSDISASGITKSPREFWLTKRHSDEIVIDYSDMLWSLVGSAVHHVLEQAQRRSGEEDIVVEERLFKKVKGRLFSGQFDRLVISDKELQDYKFTGTFAVKSGAKSEWEAQLNCLRLLLHEAGHKVDKLTVQALLRDWGKKKAKRDKNLPPCGYKEVKVPMWTLKDTKKFLENRVEYLFSFEDTPDDELPYCTYEEKWNDGDVWKVLEKGKKRSLKNHKSEIEARQHLANLQAQGRDVKLEFHRGEDTKCVDEYCNARAFCNQFKEENPNVE